MDHKAVHFVCRTDKPELNQGDLQNKTNIAVLAFKLLAMVYSSLLLSQVAFQLEQPGFCSINWEQRWNSNGSTRLPPTWPRFKSGP